MAVSYDAHEVAITLTNATGAMLTDMSVNVLDSGAAAKVTAGKMDADFGVVFLDDDDSLLPYYAEGIVGSNGSWWVKVPSVPSGGKTIRMRYAAGRNYIAFENKAGAFLFFDDFDGAALAAHWSTTTGSPSVSGGRLALPTNSGVFASGFPMTHDTIIQVLSKQANANDARRILALASTSALAFQTPIVVTSKDGTIEYEVRSDGSAFKMIPAHFGGLSSPNVGVDEMLSVAYRPDNAFAFPTIGTPADDHSVVQALDGDFGVGSTGFSVQDSDLSTTYYPSLFAESGASTWAWIRIYKRFQGKLSSSLGSETTVAVALTPLPASALASVALTLLPAQFKDAAKLRALLAGLTNVFQDIADTLADIKAQRAIAAAVGAQLDSIGAVLGFARGGLSDADYRLALAKAAKLHEGGGTIEDVYTGIAAYAPTVTSQILVTGEGGAEFSLLVDDSITGPITAEQGRMVANGMEHARAAGVYSTVQFRTVANLFKFDTASHGFDGSSGFSSVLS